jgi:cytoskeletal protein CcmA (bactofilin family)
MSIFSNSSNRHDPKNLPEPMDLAPARPSDTTFLGEVPNPPASQMPDPPVRHTLGADTKTISTGATPPEKCGNVISVGAKFQGTLQVEDSIRIDGTCSGEVQAKGTVHVAEGAMVDAKIRATYVVIAGTFRGEIRAEQKVELLPRSRINGEIHTKALSILEGAQLDGRIAMTAGGETEGRMTTRASRNAMPTDENGNGAAERRAASVQ